MVAGPLGKDVPNVMKAIHGPDPNSGPGADTDTCSGIHWSSWCSCQWVTRYHNNQSPAILFTCVHTLLILCVLLPLQCSWQEHCLEESAFYWINRFDFYSIVFLLSILPGKSGLKTFWVSAYPALRSSLSTGFSYCWTLTELEANLKYNRFQMD